MFTSDQRGRSREAGITPSQIFNTDKRHFRHPTRPCFWEGKRQRSDLGCHSHFDDSQVAGEESCPHPITPIHPSTPPGIPSLLLPERELEGVKRGGMKPLFSRIPPQCQGCLSGLIPYNSCAASNEHQVTEQHQTRPGKTSTNTPPPLCPFTSFLPPPASFILPKTSTNKPRSTEKLLELLHPSWAAASCSLPATPWTPFTSFLSLKIPNLDAYHFIL